MGSGLSMGSRAEVTGQYAHVYATASKTVKGQILDAVVEVTGWSRDNARRRLVSADKASLTPSGRRYANGDRTKALVKGERKPRAPKYSYDALRILQRIWAASGGQCGKYLAVSMPLLLDGLERHGELPDSEGRYTLAVRAELLAMSAATIDRYLKPTKDLAPLHGISTTKPSLLLRNSIKVRKAGDEVEDEPGFFEVDTVAHCGPTLKGEFARTVNLTDVLVGWTFTRSVRNNAHVHIQWALQQAYEALPYQMAGLDFDNGSEFINHAIVKWANELQLFFTRSRPYKKNDQATIESKNNHVVRRYAGYYRYDTDETLRVLNRMWPLVNDRMNFFTPTRKPIGWADNDRGKKKRIYDEPATPLARLLRAGVLSRTQERELLEYRDSLNPAHLERQIQQLSARLARLAAAPTDELRRNLKQPGPPAVTTGVKLRAVN